jgi:uncharacterized protein (DUF885 family)
MLVSLARRRTHLQLLRAAIGMVAAPAWLTAGPHVRAAVTGARSQLDKLADEYYETNARFDPLSASESGDSRYNSQLGLSISPAGRRRHFASLRTLRERLGAIPRDQLDDKARINYDILAFELDSELRFEAFPEHLLPLDQMVAVPVMLANYASGEGAQPLTNAREYRDYLNRLAQLPPWIDQAIANMREGMRRGVVLPRATVQSLLPQLKQLAGGVPFQAAVTRMPAAIGGSTRKELIQAYRRLISQRLAPALARLARFVEQAYLPAARPSSGWDALPGGAAWYRAAVAAQTTTSLEPEAIHAIGLREVARIQGQFAVLGPRMGYDGPAVGLPAWVNAQEKYRPFTSGEQVLEVYRKLDAELRAKLPALFTLRPKAPLDIRLEPELSRATASDHYTPPAADGSRPGVFWTVVNDPRQYNRTGMVTLFLHEGHPGHHFHIALLQELNLPLYRKFGGNTAYTEGWALYAETLGHEMGLFDAPEDYFGHLSDELLRAVRLVVDTGLHSRGWTREQAMQYMRDTLGYPEALARSETERYMVWPGQALAYKIGALKIAELRQRASQALGQRFSLPRFHAIVLEDGTLPLALLETKVDRWIAQGGQ